MRVSFTPSGISKDIPYFDGLYLTVSCFKPLLVFSPRIEYHHLLDGVIPCGIVLRVIEKRKVPHGSALMAKTPFVAVGILHRDITGKTIGID